MKKNKNPTTISRVFIGFFVKYLIFYFSDTDSRSGRSTY
jgi:hypothetical protein